MIRILKYQIRNKTLHTKHTTKFLPYLIPKLIPQQNYTERSLKNVMWAEFFQLSYSYFYSQ